MNTKYSIASADGFQTTSGQIVEFKLGSSPTIEALRADLETLSKEAPIKVCLLDLTAAVLRAEQLYTDKTVTGLVIDPTQKVSSSWDLFSDGTHREIWEVWTRIRKDGKWVFGTSYLFECERLPTDYSKSMLHADYLVWGIHESDDMWGKVAG
jgi:hypothetical protein